MAWAASPTRKVAGAFTIPLIQIGARIYVPGAGRFLQVDPVEGGTPNSYVYPGDPVNGSDYTGLLGVVMSSSTIRLTVTLNYGMQPTTAAIFLQSAATTYYVQPTAPTTRIQGAGATRGSTTRISTPSQRTGTPLSTPTIQPFALPAASSSMRAGDRVGVMEVSLWSNHVYPRINHALNTGSEFSEWGKYSGAAVGCGAGATAAVYGSSVSFGGTILLAGVACTTLGAAGAEIGEKGGGVLGIIVGLFTY